MKTQHTAQRQHAGDNAPAVRVAARRRGRLLAMIGACAAVLSGPAPGKDAFVLISGGGDPSNNHYSQYLQARAYAAFLHARYADDAIWTFFGGGNVEGQAPIVFDVEKSQEDDAGLPHTTWIAGALPANRPARHDVIQQAFRNEILPAVRDGGTLYLFVGDHGSREGVFASESVISLWGWVRDTTRPPGWRDSPGSLGVTELRRWLVAGIGKGRVVFVMSQCFSGGFHGLGAPDEVAPDAGWFTHAPLWASFVGSTQPLAPAAGFTATDGHTVASGCTSDVSANNWAGYERYLPEQLTGLDVFSLAPGTLPARAGFFEAHAQAAQVDHTIDKPRATSEAYLEAWATAITRAGNDPHLKPSIKPALAHFNAVLDGHAPFADNAALRERAADYARLDDALFADQGKLAELRRATAQALQGGPPKRAGAKPKSKAAPPPADDDDDDDDTLDLAERIDDWHWELWWRVIEPAWAKAVQDGSANLPANVQQYERARQWRPSARRPFHWNDDGDTRVPAEWSDYFYGGYATPATFDPALAQGMFDWTTHRRSRIVRWARASSDLSLSLAADAWSVLAAASEGIETVDDAASKTPNAVTRTDVARRDLAAAMPRPIARQTAAERLLLQRRVLAAWQFLIDVHEDAALARLASLAALERTPLPPPTR